MPESVVVTAVVLGLLSAVSLPLGAVLGVYWRPGDRPMAFFLAFGAGALIAALAVELVAGAVEAGHVYALTIGAVLGGLAFKGLNALVNRRGGYLRKPSTAIGYWKGKARARFRAALRNLKRAPVLSAFSPDQLARLLPHVLVREFKAGTTVYSAADPAENLYIIERGGVNLLDPNADRQVFQRLGSGEVFGRLSFLTGTPRGTEAVTTEDTRLLLVPRGRFFEVIEEEPDLWEPLAQRLKSRELLDFLEARQGMDAAAVAHWAAQAVSQVRATGRFVSPSSPRLLVSDGVAALATAERAAFFADLPDAELAAVAEHLIAKTAPPGHTMFHIGEVSERLYLLRHGHVALLDPHDPARRPLTLSAGQAFGALSFLTGGHHTVTAMATTECEFLVLRRKDFDDLLLARPQLRQAFSAFLQSAGVTDYLTRNQSLDTGRAVAWLTGAVKQVQRGQIQPSLSEITHDVGGHAGAATAILLGVVLDGAPEALVVGASAGSGNAVSLALLGSIFLSNFPEALSSAAGLREQGFKTARILGLWFGLMLLTGVVAGIGALTMQGAPPTAYALIEGFAAGAMLTVAAETMLPEAYQRGGGLVGLSTLAGFLGAVLLTTLG